MRWCYYMQQRCTLYQVGMITSSPARWKGHLVKGKDTRTPTLMTWREGGRLQRLPCLAEGTATNYPRIMSYFKYFESISDAFHHFCLILFNIICITKEPDAPVTVRNSLFLTFPPPPSRKKQGLLKSYVNGKGVNGLFVFN